MDSEIKNSKKMRYDAEAFVNAIAQMTDAKESDIRIKYGTSGRIVYGQTSSKEFREELDEPKLTAMVDAMQQPTNASLSDYGKSKPVIEITAKNETVFRQEKDGAVTINQVQLERDANITAAVETSAKLQQQQATTPAKKLKFSDLKKEAKAGGLTLERHKTSGYCVYVAGTRNLVHEGDRLKKLTDVQNSIEEYCEKTAAPTIEESQATNAQSDTVESQPTSEVQPSEFESINVQSEVINESEIAASEITLQDSEVIEPRSVDVSEPELIQSEDIVQNSTVGFQEIESGVANNTLSNVLEKLQVPSVFACAAKQMEALPPDNVRAVLTDWVGAVSQDVFEKINESVTRTKVFSARLSEQFKDGADKAKSFGDILSEQFKNFQSKATEFKEKTDSFGQKTTEQLQTIKTWRAEQSLAETALKIYKHHHERMLKDSDYRQQHQGEFNTFKGQKYTITQKGRNFYELTSNDTKQTLMQFKKNPWRLEINQQTKNLQPEDYREFSVIKEKLNRLGLGEVQGIGQKHYGGMQPTGKESQHKRSQEGIALT